MIASVEVFVTFLVLVFAVLLYRRLINSKWLTRLIRGFEPPAESGEDVIVRMDEAEAVAERCAEEAERDIARKSATAATIRRRTRRVPECDINVSINGNEPPEQTAKAIAAGLKRELRRGVSKPQ
jgi:hypothetical protein